MKISLILILPLFNCGKGSPKESSSKKNNEPKYRTLDDDLLSRKEEEGAVENEIEVDKIDYYTLLIDNNINVTEVIEGIKKNKNFSISEKEDLFKKLIESKEIDEEKRNLLVKELYSEGMNILVLTDHIIGLLDSTNANSYKDIIRFFIGKKTKELAIEKIFKNFVIRINKLELQEENKELERLGKILVDRYFEIQIFKTGNLFIDEKSSIEFANNILEIYLNENLHYQEINKELILHILNKIEDNPLNTNKKGLIKELKEKYKKNKFILDLIDEEIK